MVFFFFFFGHRGLSPCRLRHAPSKQLTTSPLSPPPPPKHEHHRNNDKRQKATNDAGYGLRIAETNSAINGGRKGLSEVFGAALWTADVALEFARAGALGVHMHWGVGGDPLNGGPAYVGVQTNYMKDDPSRTWPSVHAPWYGYLLYNEATKGTNVRFTYNERLPGSNCASSVKVWSLIGSNAKGAGGGGGSADDGDGVAAGEVAENAMPDLTMRVVIINKSQARGCNVELRLPKESARTHAELHWLKNDGGVGSVWGVTWRGQTYQGTMDGRMVGERDIQNLRPSPSAPGDGPTFKVPVPPGQAVLLVTSGKTKSTAARSLSLVG